jgi:hypothetical protein
VVFLACSDSFEVYPPPAWLANGANGLNGVHGGSGVSNSSSSTPGLASGENASSSGENASSSGESASSSNEEMTSEENDGQDSVEVRSQEQTPTPPATTQATTQYVGLLQIPTGFPTTAQVETFHNIDVNTIAATDNATADEVVTGEVVATGVVAAGVDHGQEIETQGMSVEEGVTAVGDE